MNHHPTPTAPPLAPGLSDDDVDALQRVDLSHIDKSARLAAQHLTSRSGVVVHLNPGDRTHYVVTVVREFEARVDIREDGYTPVPGAAHRMFINAGGGLLVIDDVIGDGHPGAHYVADKFRRGGQHEGAVLAQFVHRLFVRYAEEIAALESLDLADAAAGVSFGPPDDYGTADSGGF